MARNAGPASSRRDHGLSAQEHQILDLVASVAEKIAAQAQAIDKEDEFPHEMYRLMDQAGLVGLLVPESDGGVGASLLLVSHVYEEIARASATCATILSNSADALLPVITYADAALKKTVLERVLANGEIPCFALTEPSAGSDATAIKTRAVKDGDRYLLDGQKVFCTNGSVGGIFLVFAVTDPEARKSQRLTAFLVDRDTPGFTVGRVEETMGVRGSPLTELYFEGASIPASRRLGAEGQGLAVAMTMLNEARVGAAAMCVGICQDALDKSLAYAAERHASGRPIIDFQAVQLLIAEMAIRTEAARSLTYDAARAHDRHDPSAIALSAMCKAFASDAAVQNALDAIQVHGGYGYTRAFGIERLLRDAKAYQIFDGTSQVLRLTIAKLLRSLTSATRAE